MAAPVKIIHRRIFVLAFHEPNHRRLDLPLLYRQDIIGKQRVPILARHHHALSVARDVIVDDIAESGGIMAGGLAGLAWRYVGDRYLHPVKPLPKSYVLRFNRQDQLGFAMDTLWTHGREIGLIIGFKCLVIGAPGGI
jgi:hypothetical protein